MKTTFVAALGAVLCLGSTATFAQEAGDDWDYAADPARNLSAAAARYDAGVSIVVQCRDRALSALMIGMPPGTGGLEVQATRADGRADTQIWAAGPAPGILVSTVAPRDVRFMRGGGQYSVRTADDAPRALRTEFDLPPQSANLDRVLAECGWGLTDDRDAMARIGRAEVSFRDPDATPRRRVRAGRNARGGVPEAPPPPPAATPAAPVILPAESQISCVLNDMRLTGCRFDHPAAAANPEGAAALRRFEGTRMYPLEDATPDGKVVFVNAVGPVTIIDYITTVSAR